MFFKCIMCVWTEDRMVEGKEEGGNHRALVLYSGGLDSVLAAELLGRCGIAVTCITFTTPFFGSAEAEKAAGDQGIELVVMDITEPHLEVLKNPRYGYGKNLNPCIDCHALMVRVAVERLEEVEADFIATGEVLGERPKSQNRQALELVAKLSGAGDLLLRPLSARLMPETRPEREGWVDRDRLLDLSGRSRRGQMELAAEWGIGEYESPAGGCLLTDAAFSSRLRELMARVPGFDGADAELMKLGRHTWTGSTLVVLGRRHGENLLLMEKALPTDMLLRERDIPGPVALLRAYPRGASPNRKDLKEAARLLGIYGKGKKPLKPEKVVEAGRDRDEGG
jgi:predicted subunit of tRNA(5-methylaminomethyl-2-thiouridylate) methyltransferase